MVWHMARFKEGYSHRIRYDYLVSFNASALCEADRNAPEYGRVASRAA